MGLVAGAWTFTAPEPASAHGRPWYYPLLELGPRVYHRFECVLHVESRSTFARPNLGDNNASGGSSGVFQIEPILWDRWSWVAGVGRRRATWYPGTSAVDAVTVPAWRATLYQQAEVTATIYRHDGFGPATWDDGC